ncbi:hypothetical protein [Acidiphilium sp. C61]|uniref:hypothetical protein n=1 Tax=Acidiphilium sp. C61 TaxID=1671485 RepID=UPI00157B1372|nr:hypothetical protein [Acidiphilium sp. C61]
MHDQKEPQIFDPSTKRWIGDAGYRPRLTARCQGLGLRDEGVRLHDVCKTPPSLEMTQNNPALAALVRARPVEVMI